MLSLFCLIFEKGHLAGNIKFPYMFMVVRNIVLHGAAMKRYLEQVIWIVVLLVLYGMDTSEQAPSFCLFKTVGFRSCPGCGIGHSIHHALHLRFQQALEEHIIGIHATVGLLYLIFKPVLPLKNKAKAI